MSVLRGGGPPGIASVPPSARSRWHAPRARAHPCAAVRPGRRCARTPPKPTPSVQSEPVSSLHPLHRSLAFALALAFGLSACGDSLRRPAAVVHGVEISDAQVEATTPAARVLTALLRTSCGTQAPGEPSRSPCLRYTVGYLVEREVVREYAEAHDVRVSQAEVDQSIDALRQQYGKEQLQAVLDQFGVDDRGLERLVRDRLR